MSNIARFPVEFQQQDNIVIYDDFTRDIDSAEWVSTLTDSGTASVGDAVGGICVGGDLCVAHVHVPLRSRGSGAGWLRRWRWSGGMSPPTGLWTVWQRVSSGNRPG